MTEVLRHDRPVPCAGEDQRSGTDAVLLQDILGLREAPRPPFANPGAWLACSSPVGEQIIHIWAGGPGMGPTGVSPYGTGTIDHVSFTAIGHEAYRRRFVKYGLPWREVIIPETTLWQLFVYDPSGVQVELTFDSANEGEPHAPIAPENAYLAGESLLRSGNLSAF